jgi:hypothetical protein
MASETTLYVTIRWAQYTRYESKSRSNAFVLPVVDSGFITAELAGELLFLKAEIQSTLPNVVSQAVE